MAAWPGDENAITTEGSFAPTSVAGVQQDLRRLSETTHASHEFLSGGLRRLAEYFCSPYVAITMHLGAGVHEDRWHRGQTDPSFWRKPVDAHLTEVFSTGKASCRLLGPPDAPERVGILGTAVRNENGSRVGAIALVVSRCDANSARQGLFALESLAGYLSLCVETLKHRRSGAAAQVGMLGGISGATRTRAKPLQLAYALTNQLRNKLGCEQVAVGVPVRHRIQILSVSGMDDVHPRSPGVKQMQAAMAECYDCRETIVCAGSEAWAGSSGSGFRLHLQWSRAAGSDSVASFALTDEDTCVAVVSLRRGADRPLTKEEVEDVRASIGHLGSALRLSRLAARGLIAHGLDSARETWTRLTAPSGRKWRMIAGAAGILLAGVVFGRMEYNVLVPSTIRARSAQVLTAPFDGVLISQSAVAGQSVESGTILCRLDDRELRLKQRELESRIHRLEKQKDEAFAAGQRAKVQILAAHQDEVRAQLELVRWRLERAAIVAPFDAVVLEGDLREQVGSPVKAGQRLYEIAPPGRVFVELSIPEEEIDELRPGLSGGFASNAVPEEKHDFTISAIRPVAGVRDRRTVFTCEATFDEAAGWFRPGMEGMARVAVGRRPVWWVMLHGLIDYVRMKAWW